MGTHAAEVFSGVESDPLGLRGVYKARVKVEGCTAYYALDRHGKMIGRGLRVVWPGDVEAIIVADLRAELRVADPVRPTYLRLLPSTKSVSERPLSSLTLREVLDLDDGPAFARWLYS